MVKARKDCPPHRLHVIPEQSRDAQRELRAAIDAGKKVVYLDEVCFTKTTGKNHDWSRKGQNTVVDQSDNYTPFRAVIAGMSHERGIEHL